MAVAAAAAAQRGRRDARRSRGAHTALRPIEPVVVHAWQRRDGSVVLRGVTPGFSTAAQTLEVAVQRMRFALGVDDDYREFYDAFRGDKLLGPGAAPAVAAPEAAAVAVAGAGVAVTKQLIESPRAAAIQRRIVARWGPTVENLRDVPDAATVADVAPRSSPRWTSRRRARWR